MRRLLRATALLGLALVGCGEAPGPVPQEPVEADTSPELPVATAPPLPKAEAPSASPAPGAPWPGSPQTLATGLASPTSLHVVDGVAYWANRGLGEGPGSVMAVALEGGQPVVLAQGGAAVEAIHVDAAHVYFTERHTAGSGLAALKRVSRDGGATELLADNLYNPFGLSGDASTVLVGLCCGLPLGRYDIALGTYQIGAPDLGCVAGIVQHGGWVYYANNPSAVGPDVPRIGRARLSDGLLEGFVPLSHFGAVPHHTPFAFSGQAVHYGTESGEVHRFDGEAGPEGATLLWQGTEPVTALAVTPHALVWASGTDLMALPHRSGPAFKIGSAPAPPRWMRAAGDGVAWLEPGALAGTGAVRVWRPSALSAP